MQSSRMSHAHRSPQAVTAWVQVRSHTFLHWWVCVSAPTHLLLKGHHPLCAGAVLQHSSAPHKYGQQLGVEAGEAPLQKHRQDEVKHRAQGENSVTIMDLHQPNFCF